MCTLVEIDVINAFTITMLGHEHKFFLSIDRQTCLGNSIGKFIHMILAGIFYIPQRHLKPWIPEYLKCSSLL